MKRPLVSTLGLASLLFGCGGGASTVDNSGSTTAVQYSEPAAVETLGLITGGTVANFGVHHLSMGFTPDPAVVQVVSGGQIDAATVDTDGVPCAGWVTGQPDVIVHFDEMEGFLRFAFRPETDGEDATLVINDGQGNWHCNDDASGLNPVVDLADAPPGHYDIWIGSYSQGTNITGELLVTELSDVMP